MQNLRASFAAYWESIQQGLFPRLEQVLGSLTEKQQQLVQTLEVIRIEQMIPSRLRMPGRPRKDRAAVARAFVAKAVYDMPTTRLLLDRLATDVVLRRICGWERRREMPSESVFWSCSSSVDTYPLGEEEESTMPKSRPPYPAAFRQQMVELVRSGRTPGELAREFEPSAEAIRNWVAQADRDAGKRSDGLRTEEHEEIRRLRRENRQLREEREILAKATAWFARETGPGRSTGS